MVPELVVGWWFGLGALDAFAACVPHQPVWLMLMLRAVVPWKATLASPGSDVERSLASVAPELAIQIVMSEGNPRAR